MAALCKLATDIQMWLQDEELQKNLVYHPTLKTKDGIAKKRRAGFGIKLPKKLKPRWSKIVFGKLDVEIEYSDRLGDSVSAEGQSAGGKFAILCITCNGIGNYLIKKTYAEFTADEIRMKLLCANKERKDHEEFVRLNPLSSIVIMD